MRIGSERTGRGVAGSVSVALLLCALSGLLVGCSSTRDMDGVSDRVERLHSDEWFEDERLGMPQPDYQTDGAEGETEVSYGRMLMVPPVADTARAEGDTGTGVVRPLTGLPN